MKRVMVLFGILFLLASTTACLDMLAVGAGVAGAALVDQQAKEEAEAQAQAQAQEPMTDVWGHEFIPADFSEANAVQFDNQDARIVGMVNLADPNFQCDANNYTEYQFQGFWFKNNTGKSWGWPPEIHTSPVWFVYQSTAAVDRDGNLAQVGWYLIYKGAETGQLYRMAVAIDDNED